MTSGRFARPAGPANSTPPSGRAADPPLIANARARTAALHRPARATPPALDDLLGLVDSEVGDLLGLTEADLVHLFAPVDPPGPAVVHVSRDNAGHHPRPRFRRRPPGDSRRMRPGDAGA